MVLRFALRIDRPTIAHICPTRDRGKSVTLIHRDGAFVLFLRGFLVQGAFLLSTCNHFLERKRTEKQATKSATHNKASLVMTR
jgi:hypothetical protein